MSQYVLESPSVEESVLGALLQGDGIEPRQFDYLWSALIGIGADGVNEARDLFTTTDTKAIFEAIYRTVQTTGPDGTVTVSSVYDNLKEGEKSYIVLDNDGDIDVLSLRSLAARSVSSPKQFLSNVDELRRKFSLRRVIADMADLRDDLETGEIDSIDGVISSLDKIRQDSTHDRSIGLVSMGEKIDEIANTKQAEDPVSTGFEKLDEMINGYEDGRIYVIGARPKIGKTMFMINSILSAMEQGAYVLFISLEMTAKEILARMISAHSLQPYSKIWAECLSKNLLPSKMEEVLGYSDPVFVEAAKSEALIYDYRKFKIFSIDGQTSADGISLSSILQQIAAIKEEANEDGDKVIVFLDYLQLLVTDHQHTREQVEGFSRVFKLQAANLGIPIIMNSQINRGGAEGAPKSWMLKASGSLEQDADTVILLDRPSTRDAEFPDNILKVDTEVSRYSSTGVVDLEYLPEFQLITDLPEVEQRRGPGEHKRFRSDDDELEDDE